jgi:peptide/nickel transport system substrate-binding protein
MLHRPRSAVSFGIFVAALLLGSRAPQELTVPLAADPRTFCPLFATDQASAAVADLLHADLIRVHRRKGVPTANLASQWRWSEQHRVLEIELDPQRRFSDGSPISAADAVFSLQVAFDPELPVASGALDLVGGESPKVEALDSRRLRLRFAEARPGLERILDSLAILPRSRYQQAWQRGELEAAVGPGAAPNQIIGAGPFKLESYRPGEELVLVENRFYGKRDPAGRALPYLDRIRFVVLPDQDARLLQFQAGGLDAIGPLAPADFRILANSQRRGRTQRWDLGPVLGAEFLWFNLRPATGEGAAPIDPIRHRWFSDQRLRLAVELALDRQGLAQSVYEGRATAATGPLAPDNPFALGREVAHRDPAAAAALLEQSGYRDRDGDSVREDAQGHRLRFSLITNAGNQARESTAAFLQHDLKSIGIDLEIVPLEGRSLLARVFESGDYEAALLGMAGGDPDPTLALSFVRSSAADHWWAPGLKQPGSAWEAQLDRLYDRQARTIDPTARRRLVLELQELLAEQRPMIFLVHRHLLLAASRRVHGYQPAPLFDFSLWNADRLWLGDSQPGGS